ncbi:MAG: exodeoxyribonuclease III, partial [Pseudomonadales bacterium]|nr:exodeoxyribonuclease III [Pseudomonadales bacterium]
MRVVSFNVNSIRARLHQLDAVIKKHEPAIIGLQETKVTDEEFPVEEVNDLGYHVDYYGQKTHYGVALLSRRDPVDSQCGFPEDHDATQRRFISGKYALADGRELMVINCYFPQGENRKHPEKFPKKEKFYADVLLHLRTHHDPDSPLIVMGDMNVAPLDIDVGIGADNMKRWLREGKTCFLPEEREWLAELVDWGMEDVYRKHYPDAEGTY